MAMLDASIDTVLRNYALKASDDCAKQDLELRCEICDEHLCDAEAGDSLGVLVATILDHAQATGHGM